MSYPFHSERIIKRSRRERKCDWCGEKIPVFSRLYAFAGFHEDFYNGYLHPECRFARMNADCPDEGFYPFEYARGRIDDFRGLPPQFNELGERI
jgi:hypothetical protein